MTKLSASSAYRFIECPGSVKLSEDTPESMVFKAAVEAARIGSIIHDMAEESITAVYKGKKVPTIASLLKKHGIKDEPTKEKAKNAVKHYVSWFKKELKKHKSPKVNIEKKYRLHRDGFEYVFKADCMIYSKERLVIADLKTGNFDYTDTAKHQLTFSAALLLNSIKGLKPKEIFGVIVQPNFWIDSEKISVVNIDTDLSSYFDELEARIVTEEIKPGPHCGFCTALLTCPFMHDITGIVTALSMHAIPEQINADMLQEIYLNKPNIDKFLKSVEGVLGKGMTENGEIFDKVMLKTTYGRRSWIDEGEVMKKLKFLKDKIFEPKKLKTPAQIEKIAGKKNIEGLYRTPEYLKPSPRVSEFED